MKSSTHFPSSFSWLKPETKRQNVWSSFNYFFFSARSFDKKLESSLIYSIYLYTTIRPKYMILFHLHFLLCTIIRAKIRVSLICFFYLCTTIWPKYLVLFHIFCLLCTTIRQKIRALIDLFDQNTWSLFIYFFFYARPLD